MHFGRINLRLLLVAMVALAGLLACSTAPNARPTVSMGFALLPDVAPASAPAVKSAQTGVEQSPACHGAPPSLRFKNAASATRSHAKAEPAHQKNMSTKTGTGTPLEVCVYIVQPLAGG